MKSFQEIVVGIDFSDSCVNALRQAVQMASGEGGRVTAVHVISQTEAENYQKGFRIPTGEMVVVFEESIARFAKENLGAEVEINAEAVVGAPYHELVLRAEDGKADLLVLGSRGVEADAREVGFFASKCVRHSEVPVLLVRGIAVEPCRRVVACIDFSDSTGEVLDAALRVAADDGARLEVIHAVRPPWEKATHVLFDLSTVEDEDFKSQYREVLQGKMAGALGGIAQASGVEVESHILEHPNPEQAILNFLHEGKADIAVVGRSGHTVKILKHYLIGTTAERLIHRSPCSVLTVPCAG